MHASAAESIRLIYVSEGNIPSRAANSIQVMKMSQAFSLIADDFELVTLGDERSEKSGATFDFGSWYGLRRLFRITRLPLLAEASYPFEPNYRHPEWARRAAAYAVSRKPDVVLTRSQEAAWLLAEAGVPVVYEYHLPIDHTPFFQEPYNLGRSAHLVAWIAIHENLLESGGRAGVPREKILVCPDAVDIERFTPVLSKSETRKILGWENEGKIALYSGHLYEGRGIDQILVCAARLGDVSFVFVGGWDKDIARWKEEAEKKRLANVRFEGFVENSRVPIYLFAADVLLMPHSLHNEFIRNTSPLKLFEYMAAQRPILATDIEVFKPVLEHGRNAHLVPPDDPTDLARGLRKLLEAPEEASKLAERARNDAQNFTWDRRAEKILAHMKTHLSRGGDR